MSENPDSRRDGRGGVKAGGGGGNAAVTGGSANVANSSQDGFGQQQQQQPQQQQQQQQQPFTQDFGSWRSAMAAGPQAPSAGLGPEGYNNFYYGGGYNPFAGDIRDSIASIWSRTSPSGEGVAFSGGYGQFPDSSPGQFAANSTPAGQFAANLTGHFASTSELGMFGTPGGDYSAAYGQGYGYGPQYTQWPDGSGRGGYSYLGGGVHGGAGGGEDVRPPRDRLNDVQHGLDNMKLSKSGKSGDSNGYQSQQPKKMSWANVASQPAKPQSQPTKTKKPGVLPPPAIIPSKPPVQLAPVQAEKPSGPPPMTSAQPPQPTTMPGKETSLPPPPPPNQQQPPLGGSPMMPPPTGVMPPPMPSGPNVHGVNNGNKSHGPPMMPGGGSPMSMGPPGVGPMGPGPSNQGPRANRSATNGVNSSGNGNGAPNLGGSPGGGNSGGTMIGRELLESLKNSNEYNPKNFDLNPKNARFFVIKSFSEDDIHRSIKYQIWCSTDHGNKRLDGAFRQQNSKGPIYLFFSVNGSGHFCGVAEMLSPVDYNSTGSVWVQDKFKGQFSVKWIYVKDVPNGQLRHIRLENNENKPVTNSRDTQEVPAEKGKMVLKIIHSYKHTTSIFDDFIHYEKRQLEEEESKKASSSTGMMNAPPMMNHHNPHHSHHGGPPPPHHHGGHREDHHGHHRGERHHRGGGMGGGPPKGGPDRQASQQVGQSARY